MRRCVSVLMAALATMSHSGAAQRTVPDGFSGPRREPDPVEVLHALPSDEPSSGNRGSYAAELLWVMDGDSLRARVAGEQVEVRLADIDAPEHEQPYAWEAKLALIDLVRGKRLTLVPREVDRHGRLVARVYAERLDVSRELVTLGAAWFYSAYAKDGTLHEHEVHARAAKRGLWAIEGPLVAPWVWRKLHSIPQRNPPSSDEMHRSRNR